MPLVPHEHTLARTLQTAGYEVALARSIVALDRHSGQDAASLAELVHVPRQDVARVMRALEADGLVRIDADRARPGRPRLHYHLARPLDAAIAALHDKRRAELAPTLAALDELATRAA